MKLYYAPGACSLADHIAMHEAGLTFDRVKVDLKTKVTEDGTPFGEINPKSYVPVVEFDDGKRLTENVAILSWVAQKAPSLAPSGDDGHLRLLEMLAFISTEIHKGVFAPLMTKASTEGARDWSRQLVEKRFGVLETHLAGRPYLLDGFSVADAYLLAVLNWTEFAGLSLDGWPVLKAWRDAMRVRPSVAAAMATEMPLRQAA